MHRSFKALLALGALGFTAWSVGAAAPTSPQGVITAKSFLDTGGGTAVSDLTGNAKFPDNPDTVAYPSYFELNATGDIATSAPNAADSYGAQMVGYFYPPTTGDYVFYIASDDGGALYLSTDDTAANKKLIASESGWSGARSYTSIGGGSTVEAKSSSTYTGTQWPTKDAASGGAKITLTQGKAYYIEALMKEGGGGDNLSVAVADPNGTIDASLPIPGQYLSSYDKNTGPVKILTQPQGATLNPSDALVLKVVADGTPPFAYQWKRNGSDIPDATGPSYRIDRVTAGDNGAKFVVVVSGVQGTPVTSSEAVLKVNTDPTAPTLVTATGSPTFDTITVAFSEPVDAATAENKANYSLSGGITISAAKLFAPSGSPGDNKVILTTSKQAEGATLTLTVSNVKDLAGNTMAAGSTLEVKTFIFALGFVLDKFWDNFSANSIAGLEALPGFPDAPDRTQVEKAWEYPADGVNEGGSNYGNQLLGWFIAPKTGNYVFFTCADDPTTLYLSTDDTPANKKLIANETGWSDARNWVSVGSGDVTSKRSDQFASSEWPTPNVISLKANQRYYMESRHTEGGGGDNVAVTFIMEGEADPVNGDAPKAVGSVIGTFLDPTGAKIDISQQPQAVATVANATAKFSVAATGTSLYGTNLTYQWQMAPSGSSTFTDISGATGASYTTAFLAASNNGEKYRVVISRPPVALTSAEALLTVTVDNVPPTVTSVDGDPTRLGLTLHFSEPLDSASAAAVANYSSDGGLTISAAVLQNQRDVVLTTSAQTEGTVYTLTVRNVKDLAGNPVAANTTLAFKPANVGTGVVAYWGLDGNTGDWYKTHDGTARPAAAPPTYVAGKTGFGQALELNGTDQYVEITGGAPDDMAFAGGSMSLSIWFKVGAFDKSWQALVAKGESANWRIHRRNAESVMGFTGGSAGDTPAGTTDVSDGAWHHLVAVKDATANTSSLYIDGALDAQLENVGALSANGNRMLLGDNPDARGRYFNGVVDDLAVWNRPLLASEIGLIYAGGSGKPIANWLPVVVDAPKFTKMALNANGTITMEWTGGGTLQAAPTVTGPWQDVSGAASPYTFAPNQEALFGRIRK